MITTKDYLLNVVQADGPCSLRYALADCKQQGFTKGIVKALHDLKAEGLIVVDHEDNEATVRLV